MRVSRLVLLLFVGFQLLDGLFTYVAVHAWGPSAEGNVVLATWMALVGPLPTLVVAKGVAAGSGVLLYVRGWHGVVATMTALYGTAAIGPWLAIYRSL